MSPRIAVKETDKVLDATPLDLSDETKHIFINSFASLELAHMELKKLLELVSKSNKVSRKKTDLTLN